MAIITKESLNERDSTGYSAYLKCDIPIWEEFIVGLVERGHWATNNNFRGVRGVLCRVPNTEKYKDVYIVTHNPKSRKFYEFIENGFVERNKESYKNVKITKYQRLDKLVYVIEFEYAKNKMD